MGIEGRGGPSPEEIAEFEKKRLLNDANLIKKGAEFVTDESGKSQRPESASQAVSEEREDGEEDDFFKFVKNRHKMTPEKEAKERALLHKVFSSLKEKYQMNESNAFRLTQRLDAVYAAWGGLDAVQDKRILDIGAGSTGNSYDEKLGKSEGGKSDYEPWFCRALQELGADCVGIDIGNLEGEEFEHHKIDLTRPGALDFLPSGSFDGVHMQAVMSSPQLDAMIDPPAEFDVKKILKAIEEEKQAKKRGEIQALKKKRAEKRATKIQEVKKQKEDMVAELQRQVERILKEDGKDMVNWKFEKRF